MQIWPAIDLRGGKCVRLQQGDYDRETVYGENPAEMAQHWVSQGARCLHLVDLDGAREGHAANRAAVAAIVSSVDVPCELGGGIRDEATINELLELGLHRLVIGTKALTDPDWLEQMCHRYPQRLVVGIDARDGRVAVEGWLQTSDINAIDLARKFAALPLAAVIYTDIATDGMLAGPNVAAMAEMASAVSLPVIASGGVTTVGDISDLSATSVAGCIIGKALYEGRLDLTEALRAAS